MAYDIYINSTIGWPFSAEYVRAELNKCKKKTCNVYISSLGGSVADALQIRQMFIEHGQVEVHLHGFVASAATIIAMGAAKVHMGRYALFLMHRCSGWVDTWGQLNAEEIAAAIKTLESQKDALETIDQTIASIYAARCGKKVTDVADWMMNAKWLTAEECLDRGLIDNICEDDKAIDVNDGVRGEILACGLPLPEIKVEPEVDLSLRSFLDGFRALFSKSRAVDKPNGMTQEPDVPTEKVTTYSNLLNVLHLEALEAKAGEVTLGDEQLAALDARLSDFAAQEEQHTSTIADLTKQVDDLTAQVEALKKMDGASSHGVGDGADDDAATAAARVRADYRRLKGLD